MCGAHSKKIFACTFINTLHHIYIVWVLLIDKCSMFINITSYFQAKYSKLTINNYDCGVVAQLNIHADFNNVIGKIT